MQGMLRGDELSSAYASADIFMMPSETETLGFVALEAMASGLAVVAVAAGGLVDIVTKPGVIGGYSCCHLPPGVLIVCPECTATHAEALPWNLMHGLTRSQGALYVSIWLKLLCSDDADPGRETSGGVGDKGSVAMRLDQSQALVPPNHPILKSD